MSDAYFSAQGDAQPLLDLFERTAPPDPNDLMQSLKHLQAGESRLSEAEHQVLAQFIDNLKGLPPPDSQELAWAVDFLDRPPYAVEALPQLYSIIARQLWSQVERLSKLAPAMSDAPLAEAEELWLAKRLEALGQGEVLSRQELQSLAAYMLRLLG